MFDNVTDKRENLIEKCLTLDDCRLAFVLHKAEQILAGEDVADPDKEPEKVKAEWEAFRAEWEKKQEGSEAHE